MVATTRSATARHWADVLAIFAGLAVLALAIWPGDPSASAGAEREAGSAQLLWIAHVVSGASAIAAVFVGQRWQRRPLARGLLIVGAAVLLAALVMFRDFGPRALFTVLLPAVAMLIAATAIGPMPREV